MSEFSTPGPSGVPSGPRAGFGLRFVAAIIDAIVMAVVGFILGLLLGTVGSLLSIVAGIGYYAYFEGSPSGQTPGKRAMNIRVIDYLNGGPIDPGRALIRYLARILSSIPCGLGYLWMLWDPQKQTWHDKLSNTVVVPTSDYPVAAWPG